MTGATATATATATAAFFLLTPLLVVTSALLTPIHPTCPLQRRVPRTTLHQQKQLLQPQKGGIVVQSPPDGFVVRDVLLDLLRGRDGPQRDEDRVLLGGGAFAPRSRGSPSASPSTTAPPSSSPRDEEEPLPLFPNLKSASGGGGGGPRRISPGESAVFERAVVGRFHARSNAHANANADADAHSNKNRNTGNGTIQDVRKGGVSIRGDSSVLRSAGFVGGGGSAARIFPASFGGSTASSDGADRRNSDRSNAGRDNRSFRNGTGRDYSSSAGTKFGSGGRSGGPLGGRSLSGVSIEGDSSIFRSTGFMNGKDVVRGGGGGAGPGYGAYSSSSSSVYATTSNAPSDPRPPSVSVGSDALRTAPPQTEKYASGRSLGDDFLSASRSVKRSHHPDDDEDFDPDMPGYESPARRGEGFLTAPDPSYVDRPVHCGKWISELYAEQGLDVLSGGMEGFGAVTGEVRRGGDFGGRSDGVGYGSGGRSGYAGENGYGNSQSGCAGEDGYGNGNGNNNGYGSETGYRNRNGYGGDHGYGSGNAGYGSNGGYGSGRNNNGYRTGGDVGFDGFRGAPPQGY